jgi:adenylate kinase family enzyme
MISETIKVDTGHFGKKIVVVGKSGSGKSYSARVLIEEGRKLNVSFVIIDPQEAYKNLDQLGFHYVMAKNVKDSKAYGILVSATAKNVVIVTKYMTITEQQKFLKGFLEGYRTTKRKGIRMIVIDECHKFAPEYDKSLCKEEIRGLSQEDRSDGLGFMAVEQRTQRLDKTIISQADLLIIHNVDAKRDLMALDNYVNEPEKIKRLEVGQAFFYNFKSEPIIEKVRKAETTHSGEAPKYLLTEDIKQYDYHIRKYVKGGGSKVEQIANDDMNKKLVNVPSLNGFMDLVAAGAKMSVGLGVAGIAGAYASRIKSPLPVISTRTMASALVTLAAYTAFRKLKNPMAKDVFGYAAAGAAVHTAGSLVFDVLVAAKVNVPNFVSFALNTMTGVQPVYTEGMKAETAGSGDVDLNTQFA